MGAIFHLRDRTGEGQAIAARHAFDQRLDARLVDRVAYSFAKTRSVSSSTSLLTLRNSSSWGTCMP